MKIEIREYLKRGANGDRDTGPGVEYSDYEVVIVSDDGKSAVLSKFDGYDNWWTAPKNRDEVRREVETYAKRQATFFGAKIERAKFRPKPPKPQRQQWERI